VKQEITIATRKSRLALIQSESVAEHLAKSSEHLKCVLSKMVTTGDKRLEWSLEKEGGKGLFTKELEDALLENRADIAVHSAKDLPTEMPKGLVLAGFLPREIVNDVLIVNDKVGIPKTIATSSPRRRSQLDKMFPNIEWSTIRGNVETRLRKIAEHQADATVLAAAGLKRLGIQKFAGLRFETLNEDDVIPATGQAAIAIQCRKEEEEFYSKLLHAPTAQAVFTERLCLELMGGGCHSAMATYFKDKSLKIYHENRGALSLKLSEKEADWAMQIENFLESNQLKS
jgi:hydroxymethylbilane synthase